MKRFKLASIVVVLGALFSMVIAIPVEAAVRAVDSVDSIIWTACVGVCDRSGCQPRCVQAFVCSRITEGQSMPITSIEVHTGTTCYAFSSLDCRSGSAPVVQLIGGKPSPPMPKDKDYHTFSCFPNSLDKDLRVLDSSVDDDADISQGNKDATAVAPRADTTELSSLTSICIAVCDHVSCHANLCGFPGTCKHPTRDLSLPITAMLIPQDYFCNVYTGLTCGGKNQTIVGGQPSPKMLLDYHTYSCWRKVRSGGYGEDFKVKAITARAGNEATIIVSPTPNGQCTNAPKDWIPFARCDHIACITGCMKPGPTCYSLSTFHEHSAGPITDMKVPEGYHCLAFASESKCYEGPFQEFLGRSPGKPAPEVSQVLYSFMCERRGRIITSPPESLTSRSHTTDVSGMIIGESCDAAPKNWIPFSRCDKVACTTGCMEPGLACYPPATFNGKSNGRITDIIIPKEYHCFGFTSSFGCSGTSQEFIGGTPPTIPLQTDLYSFLCLEMGQFPEFQVPPSALTSRADVDIIVG